MKLITLYLPIPYLQAIDRLVNEEEKYPNRAEFIRLAVRDTLNVEAWHRDKETDLEFCSICNKEKPAKDGIVVSNPEYGREFVCGDCLAEGATE